jgi:hypothetical protein
MRHPLACLVALVLCTGQIATLSGDATAAPKKKPAAAEPQARLSAGTLQKLRSTDDSVVRAALDDVRTAGPGGQAAAPVIASLLEHGLGTDLTIAALDTLGDVQAESSSAAIAWYAVHRNLKVRQAAVKALAHTKGPAAVAALRHALSDGDDAVRAMAATGLGSLKAKDAVPDLFVALDHRIGEAAASIGQLCEPSQCDDLAGKLGKLPFDVVTGGLDQVLFRPPAEINDDEKVKLVGRVRELGTEEANRFLRDVQKRWPADWSKRVKQAIDQGVQATAGAAAAAVSQ